MDLWKALSLFQVTKNRFILAGVSKCHSGEIADILSLMAVEGELSQCQHLLHYFTDEASVFNIFTTIFPNSIGAEV